MRHILAIFLCMFLVQVGPGMYSKAWGIDFSAAVGKAVDYAKGKFRGLAEKIGFSNPTDTGSPAVMTGVKFANCNVIGGTAVGANDMESAKKALDKAIETNGAIIISALNKRYAALTGSDSGVANSKTKGLATLLKEKLIAKNKLKTIQRALMTKLECCPDPVGYSLQRADEILEETLVLMNDEDRKIAKGITTNQQLWEMYLGGFTSSEARISPSSGTFTTGEWESWNKVMTLMLPTSKIPVDIKNPKNAAQARYIIANEKLSIARSLINQSWHVWGLNNVAIIPAKDIIAWMGAWLSRPTYKQIEQAAKYEQPVYNMPAYDVSNDIPQPGETVGVVNPYYSKMKGVINSSWYPILVDYANRYNFPIDYLAAIVGIESSGNPKNVTGSHIGLFQVGYDVLNQINAAKFAPPGSKFNGVIGDDPRFDPEFNIRCGVEYFKWLEKFPFKYNGQIIKGNLFLMAAGYNLGVGALQTYLDDGIIKLKNKKGEVYQRFNLAEYAKGQGQEYTMKLYKIPLNIVLEGRTDIPEEVRNPPHHITGASTSTSGYNKDDYDILPGNGGGMAPGGMTPSSTGNMSDEMSKSDGETAKDLSHLNPVTHGLKPHVLTVAEYNRMIEITPAINPYSTISKNTMLRLIGERFISQAYNDKLASYDEDQVMREKLKLLGFRYILIDEIHKAQDLNSLLRSMLNMPQYEQMNRDADQSIK